MFLAMLRFYIKNSSLVYCETQKIPKSSRNITVTLLCCKGEKTILSMRKLNHN